MQDKNFYSDSILCTCATIPEGIIPAQGPFKRDEWMILTKTCFKFLTLYIFNVTLYRANRFLYCLLYSNKAIAINYSRGCCCYFGSVIPLVKIVVVFVLTLSLGTEIVKVSLGVGGTHTASSHGSVYKAIADISIISRYYVLLRNTLYNI